MIKNPINLIKTPILFIQIQEQCFYTKIKQTPCVNKRRNELEQMNQKERCVNITFKTELVDTVHEDEAKGKE